jgi:hypothetical protein
MVPLSFEDRYVEVATSTATTSSSIRRQLSPSSRSR